MTSQEIHVARDDIRTTAVVETPLPRAGENEVVLKVEGFALTANNVTYAATGKVLGYWNFFPVPEQSQGIVPVWGFARVVETKSPHMKLGERFYGFLPMAQHMKITPVPRGSGAVIDTTAHRRDLPATYNAYTRAPKATTLEDAQKAIFYPLLITSYLLFDFLQDNDWFGADQIIVGSASGKTGLGLCKYLSEARPNGPRVIGLTSTRNRDFVTNLGTCDQVVSYDSLGDIANSPGVYVDMAGNAAVRNALHHHLGDNMRHSAAVGTSHWDKFAPTGPLPGARPKFFFAPSQIQKRRDEWGGDEVERRLDGAWRRVASDSTRWLQIITDTGLDAAQAVYAQTADGQVSPDHGHYITL